jgi:ATP-dependent Clp protease ATP-binding subunit ClpC
MFDRFNDDARKVLLNAQESAREMGHGHIGPEHLFHALIIIPGNTQDTLLSLGMTEKEVKIIVDQIAGLSGMGGGNQLPFSTLAKRALEMSLREAISLGSGVLTPDHLMLGLIQDSDGPAARIINVLGSTVDAVRGELLRRISENRNDDDGHPAGRGRVFAGGSGDRGQSKILDQLATNLTNLAREKKLSPMIGRDKELERVIQILSRRNKNNPVLIGEAGVGKTAIVEGLAQRIIEGSVPKVLLNHEIFSLDLGALVAGTRYRGDFEERLKKVLSELSKNKKSILFIDEMHSLMGAGAGIEGGTDAVSLFKPLLARNEIKLIGATTLSEFRKIENDKALTRRLQTITVEEPNFEESVKIINGLRKDYEDHHGVEITDKAISAAIKLSTRYISDRKLPDKALDLIDEASARLQISDGENKIVDEEEIANVISINTGVPIRMLTGDESGRLKDLEIVLSERVVGQSEALSSLAKSVRRSRAGLTDENRPSGSFIFAGPSGVGKTELAKTLSEEVFGGEKNLIAIDMSEYSEKHAVSRLFGAPPGYVGYDEGGQLTEQVRRKPYSVVLFDEIEKAHPELLDILLQVLEEGRLTDSAGKIVDFKNTIIILTTNLGTAELGKSLGFGLEGNDSKFSAKINNALKSHLRPELINRVDDIIIFKPLDDKSIELILEKFIKKLILKLLSRNVNIILNDKAKAFLISKGVDDKLGARPMRRAVQRELEDKLSNLIISDELPNGSTVLVDVDGDKGLSFSVIPNILEVTKV